MKIEGLARSSKQVKANELAYNIPLKPVLAIFLVFIFLTLKIRELQNFN